MTIELTTTINIEDLCDELYPTTFAEIVAKYMSTLDEQDAEVLAKKIILFIPMNKYEVLKCFARTLVNHNLLK